MSGFVSNKFQTRTEQLELGLECQKVSGIHILDEASTPFSNGLWQFYCVGIVSSTPVPKVCRSMSTFVGSFDRAV